MGTGAVLMSAHDGAVDHRVFVVGVLGEAAEDALPNAGLRPSTEPAVNVLPVSEAFWQITPGNTGAVTDTATPR